MGHSAVVHALTYSPDGRTLASGSINGEIKLWNLATGQELFYLTGHTGSIRWIAFSSDGQTLVTAGESREGKGQAWVWFAPRSTPNAVSASPAIPPRQ